MAAKKVIIQHKFTVEQAAIARAKNPGVILCDRNNFCFIDFNGKEITAGDKSEETAYLVKKAKS